MGARDRAHVAAAAARVCRPDCVPTLVSASSAPVPSCPFLVSAAAAAAPLQAFYWDAYWAVRAAAPEWLFVLHDSFRLDAWAGFVVPAVVAELPRPAAPQHRLRDRARPSAAATAGSSGRTGPSAAADSGGM